MSDGNMQCHGCGSSNITFDPRRRTLHCNQCGKEEYYSRATLNSNGKVVYSRRNAVKFFTAGNYDLARHSAEDVIGISLDNAPALYILNYYDEFVSGRAGALKRFFTMVADTPLEYDEVTELMSLFTASPNRLLDCEKEVIELIAVNMQSEKDTALIGEFFDKLCPYLISKRSSTDFLTAELAEDYRDLAKHCGIPKTCYALLNGIRSNPESPYVSGTFFLKGKTQYFFDHYVLPVGDIIDSMKPNEFKEKFRRVYAQRKAEFMKDAGI